MNWNRFTRLDARPDDAALEAILPLEMCKSHIRVERDYDGEDQDIKAYRRAAFARLDGPERLGVSMVSQRWRLTLCGFPSKIDLELAPVTSVERIAIVTPGGAEMDLAPGEYRAILGLDPAIVSPLTAWPQVAAVEDAVRVDFTAGYTADTFPPDLLHALKLLVGHYYKNREMGVWNGEEAPIPEGIEALTVAHRRGIVA